MYYNKMDMLLYRALLGYYKNMNLFKEGRAACEGMDFFQQERDGETHRQFEVRAKKELVPICGSCAIKAACLSHALEHNIDFGVWGGLTPEQRKELRRRGVGGLAS